MTEEATAAVGAAAAVPIVAPVVVIIGTMMGTPPADSCSVIPVGRPDMMPCARCPFASTAALSRPRFTDASYHRSTKLLQSTGDFRYKYLLLLTTDRCYIRHQDVKRQFDKLGFFMSMHVWFSLLCNSMLLFISDRGGIEYCGITRAI